MFRPKKMSRVSVAGSKSVLKGVIEEIHDLNAVHVTDYDGSWEGFENGNPLEGGEETSGKLVQVRAVMNTLGVDGSDYDNGSAVTFESREELYDRFEGVRESVNELEDERNHLRDSLRDAREKRRTLEPFVELGIDLELLRGYDEIDVRVGQGNAEEVRAALSEAEGDEYEVFEGDGVLAVAARDVDLNDTLVGAGFSEIDVPEMEGNPSEALEDVEGSIAELEEEIEEIEEKLDEIRDENANFLLAAEEELSIEAQKTDAPLRFATTANSFYAEGWIPTESYSKMVERLQDAVGDRVDVRELETVKYNEEGYPEEEAEMGEDGEDGEGAEPPVVQDNPGVSKPFELFVDTVNRPKYSELDPTIVIFLTFPFFFGFMIGDMGYGLVYTLMGVALYKYVDSDAIRTLGIIAIWAGVFTFMFGYLYDDFFGVHTHDLVSEQYHLPLTGVIHKGLETADWALLWVIGSLLFGILHLNIGFVMGFVNEMRHSLKHAVYEHFSWILVLNGFFAWVFSTHAMGSKPDFIVGSESTLSFIGFTGFPATVGLAGLGVAAVGIVLVGVGEGMTGIIEVPTYAFGHVLSYLRIVAVLLAKGGMAFVVNLLVFGGYESHGHTAFGLYGSPSSAVSHGEGEVVFEGLVWLGLGSSSVLVLAVALLGALLIFLIGHVLVILLGITAAGIQMIRLEWVEFFGKFYEGGGTKYEPFGKQRKYTKEGK